MIYYNKLTSSRRDSVALNAPWALTAFAANAAAITKVSFIVLLMQLRRMCVVGIYCYEIGN